LTTVTGVSGSGKSSLIAQALVDLVVGNLGHTPLPAESDGDPLEQEETITTEGRLEGGLQGIKRLIQVDQKPIGRTPRSNLATYTGLFDHVRRIFAATPLAKRRRYDAGQFSFNVAKGRCPNCNGEGFVMVELLFLPSVYAPCPVCQGMRYNPKTLEIAYRGKSIADVLSLTVDAASEFFAAEESLRDGLAILREVGVGYLRLGQPATELSGGEAQRIKLASELQRIQKGQTLYVLDEPTTGLHPADVEKLILQLDRLVTAGNTVVVIEHEMRVAAISDWIIDIGPGAGEAGGKVVVAGPPDAVARHERSHTAPFLEQFLNI
jgi:excinuclease ABC subunit A